MIGFLDRQNSEFLEKLLLPAAMIAAAFLASRRWGEAIGGLLVALPLTSGWIAFFLAQDLGTRFSTDAAMGSLVGTVGQAGFALVYAATATRRSWPLSLALACTAFGVAAASMEFASARLPQPAILLLAAGGLGAAAWLLTVLHTGTDGVGTMPQNLWTRAGVTVLTILGITALAPALGAWLSGLLATFPTLGAIVACFNHRERGPGAAVRALRGFSLGLFSTAGFFVVILCCLERLGITLAFSIATVTALSVQAVMFAIISREGPA